MYSNLLKIVFLWTFIAIAELSYSQDIVYEVRGSLVNTEGRPIQFAHIVNINKSVACISDTAGRFRILMIASDTVRISCLGYEPTGFTLKRLTIEEGTESLEFGKIVMSPKVYEIETVNIYAERWKSFIYDYTHVEMEDEPLYMKQIEHWKENLIDVETLRELSQGARGVGFALNFNRKREKAKKKIEEFKRQDVLNAEAAEKYNPKVISDITGLSLEESEKFMWHFKLDRDFIISRNDYDLYLIIKQLYNEYKKL